MADNQFWYTLNCIFCLPKKRQITNYNEWDILRSPSASESCQNNQWKVLCKFTTTTTNTEYSSLSMGCYLPTK
jgi:hypothetical protein